MAAVVVVVAADADHFAGMIAVPSLPDAVEGEGTACFILTFQPTQTDCRP
jgi:hypothetical protein